MQPPKPQLDPKQTVVQRCPLRSDQHKGQITKGGFSPYFHLQRIKARPLVPELGVRESTRMFVSNTQLQLD